MPCIFNNKVYHYYKHYQYKNGTLIELWEIDSIIEEKNSVKIFKKNYLTEMNKEIIFYIEIYDKIYKTDRIYLDDKNNTIITYEYDF